MEYRPSKNLRILPVILARADSSRLPNKVMAAYLGGRSMLDCIVEQVQALGNEVAEVQEPVIATSLRSEDNAILDYGIANNVSVFRGSLFPMIRMSELAKDNVDTWLWRINADSPLILFPLIAHAVTTLKDKGDSIRVVTNLVNRTFPYGVSLEMYYSDWLCELLKLELLNEEKEHVTPILQRLPQPMIHGIETRDIGIDEFDSTVRLTIDNKNDADFFQSLWLQNNFSNTQVGSIARIKMAYGERNKL